MEARPTEYCGIKFKSKSEARIAHLFTTRRMPWVYEPTHFTLPCGYVPDFYSTSVDSANEPSTWLGGTARIWHEIYEYKPRRPTETYMEELKWRLVACELLLNIDWNATPRSTFIGYIIIGGMGYEKAEYKSFSYLTWDSNWRDGWPGIRNVDELLASQKSYRFDLERSEAR